MARFPNPSPALPPNARRTCHMPYFPDPGVDARVHSQTAGCKFHVVKEGFMKGCFTNANAATLQVEGCSTNTEDEAKHEWAYHTSGAGGNAIDAPPKPAKTFIALVLIVPHFTSNVSALASSVSAHSLAPPLCPPPSKFYCPPHLFIKQHELLAPPVKRCTRVQP
ncbi:hypothetical protein C8R43DRAFT_1125772 [Mycena crocata]|nr:hypothetical protein C8R43DRAFT_1125772 [Mycena crocata]